MHIDADDSVSKKIRAYDRLVTFIESGDIESARKAENLHLISVNHLRQLSKLNENNWKDANGKRITGFDKIKEEKSPSAEPEKTDQVQKPDKKNKDTTPEKNRNPGKQSTQQRL